jgi:hypothetical protein
VIRARIASRSSTAIRSDAVANTLRRRSFIASSWWVSAAACPEVPGLVSSSAGWDWAGFQLTRYTQRSAPIAWHSSCSTTPGASPNRTGVHVSIPLVQAQCSMLRGKPSAATATISAKPGRASVASSLVTVLNSAAPLATAP